MKRLLNACVGGGGKYPHLGSQQEHTRNEAIYKLINVTA